MNKDEITVTDADLHISRFICSEYICDKDRDCKIKNLVCSGCFMSDEEIAENIARSMTPERERAKRMMDGLESIWILCAEYTILSERERVVMDNIIAKARSALGGE